MTNFRKVLIGAALIAAAGAANAATDYPSGYTKCAKEGATCSFTGTRSVAYGKSGTFVYATLTGPITCSGFAVPVDRRRQPAVLLVLEHGIVQLEHQQLNQLHQLQLDLQLDFELEHQQFVLIAAAAAASRALPARRRAARRSRRPFVSPAARMTADAARTTRAARWATAARKKARIRRSAWKTARRCAMPFSATTVSTACISTTAATCRTSAGPTSVKMRSRSSPRARSTCRVSRA